MRQFSVVIITILFLISAQTIGVAKAPSEIERFTGAVSVGEPQVYRNLAVYPVTISRDNYRGLVLSLDEAMDRGYLRIREMDDAEVNTVLVDNKSDRSVFMMRGEVIEGAQQDRMSAADVLIPPHAKSLQVGVFCTEHGRWAGNKDFAPAKLSAAPSMRQSALETKSQTQVWEDVETTSRQLAMPASPSGALKSVVKAPEVQSNLKAYTDALKSFPRKDSRLVGVVAVLPGRRILVADLFGNHELFVKYWNKLLESYAVEALHNSGKLTQIPRSEIERFIKNSSNYTWRTVHTPGSGRLLEITSGTTSGSALVHSGGVVHMDLFPREIYLHQETPRPPRPISPRRYGR